MANDKHILSLVQHSLGLSSTEQELPDEEAMIHWLAGRIDEMLEYEPDLLFSTLYRLDVSETALANALAPQNEEPGHIAVARVVWARQKERYRTKTTYQTPPLDDEELAY